MGAESEPKSGIEYRRPIPFRKWSPLGKGLFMHTEDVTHAILTGSQRIITAVMYDECGDIVVTDMVFNKELEGYESRTTTFSRKDLASLNDFVRVGLIPRQFRQTP